jgi:hypothetical protein
MRRLLVISDLYLDPTEVAAGAPRLPQLPALSVLLDRGRAAAPCQDWRVGLAADLGAPALASAPIAQVAASAVDGLAPGSPVCMAAPVHLVAGMASVHLHPAGLLYLDPASVAELQGQFQREFGARDQALHAAGDGLLLAAPAAAAATAWDPARLLGSAIEATRSADAAQQALRRLGVEIEMWLPGLTLNRDRERRGELPITALWFWGGGKAVLPQPAAAGAPAWEQAYGADPWLHGIWRSLANRPALNAHAWDDLQSSALVVASAVRSALPQLESAWFAPALRDLQAGRLSALALRIGGRRWDLGARPRTRWWRRSRTWWQVLAA